MDVDLISSVAAADEIAIVIGLLAILLSIVTIVLAGRQISIMKVQTAMMREQTTISKNQQLISERQASIAERQDRILEEQLATGVQLHMWGHAFGMFVSNRGGRPAPGFQWQLFIPLEDLQYVARIKGAAGQVISREPNEKRINGKSFAVFGQFESATLNPNATTQIVKAELKNELPELSLVWRWTMTSDGRIFPRQGEYGVVEFITLDTQT
jgi:hypothetical protein